MNLKVGVVYPQIELKGDPQALRDFARSVEAMGFNHLVMYDHVVGAVGEHRDPPLTGPYRETDPFHDPLIAYAHLAALTSTLEFCPGVMILPQRQTVLVARQAADLDLLSGGRFSLGIGVGWNPVEYEALGIDFKSRGERLTEQIELLRRLWSGEVVDFQGKHHRVDRAALVPAPANSIPIICGGLSAPAYRRAAKHADGFIFTGPFDEVAVPGLRKLHQLLEENERGKEGFRADLDVVGRPAARHGDFEGLSVPDLLETLETWETTGGTHAAVKTMGMGYTTVDEHLEHLVKVADALGLR
ncbi:LLM class F420-dependent oxidoreductase [Williamsia sp. D3]|uniref:LLM class F420-dependent oxidoreductase n=1 Tax=Williamsia sp. D3 TaxID=1313067 RepID=UPI001F3C3791|nr:LLM class F420-dependent oxidoreductase [Williamsia sp. D3]